MGNACLHLYLIFDLIHLIRTVVRVVNKSCVILNVVLIINRSRSYDGLLLCVSPQSDPLQHNT